MHDGATDNGKQGVSPGSRADSGTSIVAVDVPGSGSAQARAITDELAVATTDRGAKLPDYREGDVTYALTLLIRNGGNGFAATVEQLADADIVVTKRQLRDWRDRVFRSRYFTLRQELSPEIEEAMAGDSMEIAQQATEAQRRLLALIHEKAEDIRPDALPRGVQALSAAKAHEIEKARLLRDKPTEIRETRTVEEIVATLRRLEVLKVIDG